MPGQESERLRNKKIEHTYYAMKTTNEIADTEQTRNYDVCGKNLCSIHLDSH